MNINIANDSQFHSSFKRLKELKAATNLSSDAEKEKQELITALRNFAESMYGVTPDGKIKITNLNQLPYAITKARVLSGQTREDLGAKLKVKKTAIQRYEEEGYKSISLHKLLSTIDACGLSVDSIVLSISMPFND